MRVHSVPQVGVLVLAVMCAVQAAEAQTMPQPLPKTDQNMKTGPAVGAAIPKFEALDQNGHRQTFETLRGPKGLVLLFVRSADW